MLTTEQRILLAGSEEFQKLISNDPRLDELNRAGDDRAVEFASIMEMLGNPAKIGQLEVKALTPALWAFLWGIGNSYTGELKRITEADTDVFLFLLSRGNLNFKPGEIAEIPVRASGWCEKFSLGYPEAAVALIGMIHRAFRPLEMLPGISGFSDSPRYDADWLASLCSAVALETNERVADVMNMPLSACCFFFVGRCRKNDVKGLIHRKTGDEIIREIVTRVERLGEQFISGNFRPKAETTPDEDAGGERIGKNASDNLLIAGECAPYP